jgi:anti-anti-sigma factor
MSSYLLRPAPSEFGLEVSVAGDQWVVTVRGDVDATTAGGLRSCLQTLHDDAAVVVDLSAVGFIDSVGIGVVVGAQRTAAVTGRPFAVRAPSRAVSKVLDLTEVAELVEVAR